jgi:hypothetical protein
MSEMTPDEFWNILYQTPEPLPVFYRLYHDEQGFPLFYSMEDVPGNYIEIDRETFVNTPNVRVVNGQLITLKTATVTKLRPDNTGTACDPRDVSIVVDESRPNIKWSLK